MIESFKSYFMTATDDELVGFFSVFTDKERREEFADLFGLINCILWERDGDEYVIKYFMYRDLIVKEMDTSAVGDALDKLIATNEKAWKEYIGGNDKAIGRFIGQLTKATGITPQDAKAFIEKRKSC